MTKTATLFLLLLAIRFCAHVHAQSLSFTPPENFLPAALTDKAVDITNLNGHFFIAWKTPGSSGNLRACYLGKANDTVFSQQEMAIAGGQTSTAPVLRVLGNRIYLFWISPDGAVKYVINDTDTSLNTQQVYTVRFRGDPRVAYGITSTAISGKVLIASHGTDKKSLVYSLLEPDEKGVFKDAELLTVKGRASADYPFVVSLSDSVARFCWRGFRDQSVNYADLNIFTGSWTAQTPIGTAQTRVSPALYSVWSPGALFYIWKGAGNNNKIYYTTEQGSRTPGKETVLPDYFSTRNPVSICNVDNNNFIMVYIGEDQRFYISYFSHYDPARWMEEILLPEKGHYTLKDIVIPGSHDAGMSVLSGIGGQVPRGINECNTLTQKQGIGAQLLSGIRMFDLRVGIYNNQLYTKHFSSDCAADAVGGGYGERLADVLAQTRAFLKAHDKEIVLFSLSHFCDKEIPTGKLADSIAQALGSELLYKANGKRLQEVSLRELQGKAVIAFECAPFETPHVNFCTMTDTPGNAFINFRRKYAATNDLNILLARQVNFFDSLKQHVAPNDLIRLDWQLTQSSQEAALICNGYQPDKTGGLFSGVVMLANAVKKNQTILELSVKGNRYLAPNVQEWIKQGTINRQNKPNILYVDVADTWITDYCIDLNKTALYNRQE